MKRLIILVSLTVVLMFSIVGCLSTQQQIKIEWDNSYDIKKSIKIKYDEFKKVITFVGPSYPGGYILKSKIFLRAWKYDKNPEHVIYQIYISSIYDSSSRRNYTRAYDSNGISLETTSIHHDVSCYSRRHYTNCTYFEHIGVSVSEQYLRNHINGIKLKIEGSGGSEIHNIPALYIKTFLDYTN